MLRPRSGKLTGHIPEYISMSGTPMLGSEGNIRKRDDHLRSGEFFAVKQYPLMTFKTENIRRAEGNRFELEGKLTVKDVTKKVVVPFTYFGMKENPLKPKQKPSIPLIGCSTM